jgi:lysophospholipase L1-like esterase
MIDAGQYLPHLARGDITHFLFSGAGNDILGGGQLHRFLRLFNIDHRTPDDAGYYPTPAFYDALDRVETLFRQLSRTVLKISPRTQLVLHGYDYALPRVDGPFLGRSMERQGLDPVSKADLCQAIIRFMVETFNRRLDRLSRELSNVTYVNFVGTLSPNDWFDELHAREAGAVKLARKLADQLGWHLEAQALHEADAIERAEPRDMEFVEIRITNGDAPEDAASARRMGLLGDDETQDADEVGPLSVGEQEELSSEAEADDEAFGVPFPELDAFERLSETAPDVDDPEATAHEADRQERGPAARRRTEAAGGLEILFGPNAKAADVTELSRRVLQDIMRRAGLSRVTISSTSRSPADQARVMFDNLERFGVNHQKALYGPAGDLVIEVYRRAKNAGLAAAVIKERMRVEIVRVGPTRVSRHAADPKVLNVFDVAPSSVQNRPAFEQAVRQDARVSRFITPPTDPGYHLEIPQSA